MASDPASRPVARPGRAIFLVGPSSSGKTAIGRELIATLPDPWYFYESDLTRTFHAPTDRFELATPEMERRLTYGTALALRGYLDAGLDLIVERALWWPGIRAACASVFADCEAYLVGLDWKLRVLELREERRADGIFGGTARQQALGWDADAWNMPFDIRVDAAAHSPSICARLIVDWLAASPEPTAIRTIVAS